MDVAVIGAGRVGTAVAMRLRERGHRIVGVSGRGATAARATRFLPGVPVVSPIEAARTASIILIATPDDAIESTCLLLVRGGGVGAGQAVAHLSGATSLEALDAARSAGATVVCVHPLQTFADVISAVERLPGSPVAVTAWSREGLELGDRLAAEMGGRPFPLDDAAKPLYHAAAVFASNYLVVVTAVAADLLRAAGLEDPIDLVMPLQRATLDNVASMGVGAALTGPSVRADVGTVARNLEVLARHAPEAVPAYVDLARLALDLGDRSGRLSAERRLAVEEVLERWS